MADGDRVRSDVPFYALGFAMARPSRGWRTLTSPAVEVARPGESPAGTGGLTTSTLQVLAQPRPKATRARSLFLGEAEQEILFDLERIADDRPLLLVADNLHWWDRQSLELTGRLTRPEMAGAFPFLANLRIVTVQTPEPYQSVSHPEVVHALLEPRYTRYFMLDRVSRHSFGELLVGLGANDEPDRSVTDAIFGLTGGHLALARRCIPELNERGGGFFVGAVTSSEFVARLLTERLRSLGSIGHEAIELLQVAAVLGLQFRRDEVACAWGEEPSQTSRVLRRLRDEDMVELSEETGFFVHEVYREHFLNSTNFDRVGVHERLVDCLRLLSPAEYELRMQNAVMAEQPSEAATYAMLAALAFARDGRSADDLSAAVRQVVHSSRQSDLLDQFVVAMAHLSQDDYSACIAQLDLMPRTLPEPLLAEADYLRSKCLMQTRSREQRALARAVLDSWDGYEDTEPEIGLRLMLQKLFGLSALLDKSQARQHESRLRSVLRRRARFDKAAEDSLYTLDRCSPGLYEPDVSLLRVRDAAEYYRPTTAKSVVRRPAELYLALVNLASVHVGNAQYSEALSVSSELEDLVASYSPGTFLRLDIPLGTALLARYRLGLVSSKDAARHQSEIIARHGAPGDPFYPGNALAVYLALASRHAEALVILAELLALLDQRPLAEPSMEYMLRANRCSVRFVAGDRAGLEASWRDLDAMVAQIPWPGARFYQARHELLAEVFTSGAKLDAAEFDSVLLEGRRPELGPMWEQVGRGFMLPEVEWWH